MWDVPAESSVAVLGDRRNKSDTIGVVQISVIRWSVSSRDDRRPGRGLRGDAGDHRAVCMVRGKAFSVPVRNASMAGADAVPISDWS